MGRCFGRCIMQRQHMWGCPGYPAASRGETRRPRIVTRHTNTKETRACTHTHTHVHTCTYTHMHTCIYCSVHTYRRKRGRECNGEARARAGEQGGKKGALMSRPLPALLAPSPLLSSLLPCRVNLAKRRSQHQPICTQAGATF